jgi:hypothetical protein
MMRFLIALSLLCLALGANGLVYLQGRGEAAPIADAPARVMIANETLNIPREMLRDPAALSGARTSRLDFAVAIADFSPLPAPDPKNPDAPLPDRLMFSILSVSAGSSSPIHDVQALYARFFDTAPSMGQDGLVTRRFRAGTPYEDQVLQIGATASGPFVILCPKNPLPGAQTCTGRMRVEPLDFELRFPAAYLPHWRQMVEQVLDQVESWREISS